MDVRSTYSKIKVAKKKKSNSVFLVWLIVIAIILLGSVIALLFLPFWQINKIEAAGTEKISASEFIDAAEHFLSGFWLKKIPKNNYFLISSDKLAIKFEEKFPGLKEIKILKKFPSSLAVEARDREKMMIYCGKIDCFYLDETGVIFEDAPEIYGGLKAVLKDNSDREIKKGEKAIEPKLVNFVVQTQKLMNDKININLVNFEISKYSSSDISAVTPEEWKILLDSNLDLTEQVLSLKKILEEKIKDQRTMLEYIDLRIENRVYYKMKN